jgi:hypothetical protein
MLNHVGNHLVATNDLATALLFDITVVVLILKTHLTPKVLADDPGLQHR